MATRDIGFEYTENKYSTRREISNEIGVKITDEMWNRIVTYRKSFYDDIQLRDNANKHLSVCLCPSVATKLNVAKTRLERLNENFSLLNETSGDKSHFRLMSYTEAIVLVAKLRNISIESSRAKRLISSENPYDELEEGLLDYLAALRYIADHKDIEIDDNYLADLYSLVSNNPELTSFYRVRELEDDDSRAMVSRVYNHASTKNIETMMNGLFTYIKTSKHNPILKGLVTYFYVDYVHPFDKYNDEIAILLAKAAMRTPNIQEVVTFLPLENLLTTKLDYTKKNYQEILLSSDVTYFIAPVLPFIEAETANLLDLLNEYSVQELRKDFYQEEEKEEKVETPAIKQEVKVEEVKEKEPEVIFDKKKEEPQKIDEKEELIEDEEEEDEEEEFETIPVELIPNKIDEKEARRLQEHLLELDYRLKKHEAYFFARHHNLGSYYTIEQYKKTVKCVYETARTSMEHLVELGYYEKKKVGKKFVYTPKKRNK